MNGVLTALVDVAICPWKRLTTKRKRAIQYTHLLKTGVNGASICHDVLKTCARIADVGPCHVSDHDRVQRRRDPGDMDPSGTVAAR